MTDQNDVSASSMRTIGENLEPLPETVKVDAIDLAILRRLVADGRIPHKRLADELHMSAPAISERITRLTQRGVIAGFAARINWEALGFGTIAYLQVRISHTVDRGRLMLELAAAPGVEEVTLVTGAIDVLVRMRVRDNHHLRRLLTESVWTIDGIERTETSIALGQVPGGQAEARILDQLASAPPSE